MKNNLRIADLKCPYCGHLMKLEIPENRCLVFERCKKCQTLIETPQDKCCIICAFSDQNC